MQLLYFLFMILKIYKMLFARVFRPRQTTVQSLLAAQISTNTQNKYTMYIR